MRAAPPEHSRSVSATWTARSSPTPGRTYSAPGSDRRLPAELFHLAFPATVRARPRADVDPRPRRHPRAVTVVGAKVGWRVAVVAGDLATVHRPVRGRTVTACATVGVDAAITRHARIAAAHVSAPVAHAELAGRAIRVVGARVVGAMATWDRSVLNAASLRARGALAVRDALEGTRLRYPGWA